MMAILYVLAVLLTAIATQTDGASAVFEADNVTPRTGEPVTMTLRVMMPAGYELLDWPEISSAWGAFDVADLSPVKTDTRSDGGVEHTQTFTIRLWRPDEYETPEMFVGYQRPGESDILRIPVRPVVFSVPSVLDREDLTLRPYIAPRAVFYVPGWIMGVAVLGVMGAIAGGWRWWSVAQSRREDDADIAMSPAQIADQALAQAEADADTPYTIAIHVTDALYRFITVHYDVEIEGLTTVELKSLLVGHESEDRLVQLVRLLDQLDLVKYTGVEPNQGFMAKLIIGARQWVAAVDITSEPVTEASTH